MITELNTKYSQAIIEGKRCLSLTETITQHKIPTDDETLGYLILEIKTVKSREYPENHFNRKNLFNSNYNDLSFHDFEKYRYLSEISGLKNSGQETLKSLLKGSEREIEVPILVKGKNEIYWQLTGNLTMMAYKVLGIFPVIREIPINAQIIS